MMIGVPTSKSHEDFRRGLEEFNLLVRKTREATRLEPPLAIALRRIQPVVLCSLAEGYVEQLFLETWEAIDRVAPSLDKIPDRVKRLLFEYEAETLLAARTSPTWIPMIRSFLDDLGSIVPSDGSFNLRTSRIGRRTERFHGVSPENLVQLFRYLDIADIFDQLEHLFEGRTTSEIFRLQLKELVDRRNEIAHGLFGTAPTLEDNLRYCSNLRSTCRLVDLAAGLKALEIGGLFPWRGQIRSSSASLPVELVGWLFD